MAGDGEAKLAMPVDAKPAHEQVNGTAILQGELQLMSWPKVVADLLGVLVALYLFLLGLDLMGDAFKCLGGRSAGSMFSAVDNPVAGLMVGILATVLVQSSSTSTSIVVGLVGADQITVRQAIPIIMGANIGTSVTNTIVSMGQIGDRAALERAFSGATVHDMFNMLAVLTLLPLELLIAAATGEGGPLYWITYGFTEAFMGGSKSGELFKSPIKTITGPAADLLIHNDKYLIKALALGEPSAMNPVAVNATACDFVDCSTYCCVPLGVAKNWQKVAKAAYRQLASCEGYVLEPADTCGRNSCRLGVPAFYQEHITEGRIIDSGLVQGAGDMAGGTVVLILSLILLCGGLFLLVQILQRLLSGRARHALVRATKINDYAAIFVGILITILVQSSSVTTSVLTPLCGMGVLPLKKMLPLTLGANIGTTVTALIAALVVLKFNAVHIALCHLFFNIIGIMIWFPVPVMRDVPLGAAELLGMYASFYRAVPCIYIVVTFVLLPLVAIGVSALFGVSLAGGVVTLLVVLASAGAFGYWWLRAGGCYWVLSRAQRETRARELEAATALGDSAASFGKPAAVAASSAERSSAFKEGCGTADFAAGDVRSEVV